MTLCGTNHKPLMFSNYYRNNQTGSVLAESGAGMIVLTMMAVGLLMIGINIYSIVSYDSRLNFIAQQTALAYEKYQYWLGMQRTDFDPSTAASDATAYAKGLAKLSGLNPANLVVSFPASQDSIQLPNAGKTTITPIQVQVQYSNFSVPFNPGGLFAVANGTRTVTAAIAAINVPAPMLLDVYAMDNNKAKSIGQTAQIPAYGMYYPHGGGMPTNGPHNLNQMHGGLPGPEPGMTMSQWVQSPSEGPIAANYYIGLALSQDCTMSVPVDTNIPAGSTIDANGNITNPAGQRIDAAGNPISKAGH